MLGRLQPYALYVPDKPQPAEGYGLTLLLHSLGGNYNQFSGSRNQSQFGDRGPGSLVITPQGRGPDGWYYGLAGADTFEVWADVAARYKLDPEWVSIAGYSMGGYGTYKFATQYPDLFAKGQPTVGPPGIGIWAGGPTPPTGGESTLTNDQLASLRHVPFKMWYGIEDELVPFQSGVEQQRELDRLGYRYEFDAFHVADHLQLADNDQYAPAAQWLGTTKVVRNPAHVTYVRNPSMDFPDVGTTADHAYWLSKIGLRDAAANDGRGTIDVRSAGFGVGDPPARPTTTDPVRVLEGGRIAPLTYSHLAKTWGPAPATPVRDLLEVTATNIGTVTVDVQRAKVTCGADVRVTSDGPVDVVLAGCGRTVRAG